MLIATCYTGAYATYGTVKIVKNAEPNSSQKFNFLWNGSFPFVLQDNGNNSDGFPNFIESDEVEAGTYTIKEDTTLGWKLESLSCKEDKVQDSTVNLSARTATIRLQYRESITCTFKNVPYIPTAADVTLYGKVLTFYGRPVNKATVQITDASNGEIKQSLSNAFGYYNFTDLESGRVYLLDTKAKGLQFMSQVIILQDNLADFDILALY